MRTILTISLLLLMARAGAQTEKITLAENNLRGQVKEVKITANWMKEMFGEWEPNGLYYSEAMEFNKKGLLTRSAKQENFDWGQEYLYKYDRNDRLVQKKNIYGKKGKKEERIYRFVVDEAGRLTEEDFSSEGGELYWRNKMKYLPDGRQKETFYYDGDGDLYQHARYEYNDQQRKTVVRFEDREGKEKKVGEITYDAAGNKVGEVTIEYVGKITTITAYGWTYRDGKKIKEMKRTEKTGEKTRTVETEYDEWGNVIRLKEYTGTVYTTTYTFDSQHNWITATCTFKGFDGPTAYRITREIKYY